MDQEAKKAIEEALYIFEEKKSQEPPPAAPIDTLPTHEQPEEEPTEQPPEISAQQPEPPIVTALEHEPDIRLRKRQKRGWLALAGLMAGVISVTIITMLVIVPLLRPTAIVTIIPAQATVTADGIAEVQGRSLSTVSLTQGRTVPATGSGHQDAQAAQGSVTFYNGYTGAQTIPAGTLLQTAGGVQIVTDADANVPPANPPTQGQATIPAHALTTGTAGNIPAYSIYGACCRAYILVENTAPLTGGQSARTFQAVTQSDLDNATGSLKASLMHSVNAMFGAQLQQGEAIVPPDCAIKSASDHKAGEEGTQAGVTVTADCSARAYQTEAFQAQAVESLTTAASQQLGNGYIVTGDPHVTVTGASASGSMLRLTLRVQGTMAYQFGQAQLQAIKNHIAGMDKAEAAAWIARQPGVKAVSIDVSAGVTLPQEANAIRYTLLYAA